MIDGQSLFITNYEMVDGFDFSQFGAVVLDESSILKAISGKTRQKLTDLCQVVPYRLCCTATPAPNDHVELGNHAEFLGICTRSEMLAMFFINANKQHTYYINGKAYERKGSNAGGTEWRLKHHAERPFFQWLASWAIALTKPSDLGYDDNGFILPELIITPSFVPVRYETDDQLFFTHIKGIGNAADIRRATAPARLERLQELINYNSLDVSVSSTDRVVIGIQSSAIENSSALLGEQWVVWCGLNEEQKLVEEAFGNDCVSVHGSLSLEEKIQRLDSWLDKEKRILVSKPTVLGFGLNLQQAHNMAFFGLNYSWEQYYQCIRREWRYLQDHPVNVHIIMSDVEEQIYKEIVRKDNQARRLRDGLIDQIRNYEEAEIAMRDIDGNGYEEDTIIGEGWTAMLGDSCERMKEIDDNSVALSVYSPPFADLYTYTDSERDLGNSRDWDEFFKHYAFLIQEVLRVTMPGRLTCVHTSDIPAMAQKDGYIGVKDFPGAVIRAYENEGWTFIGRAFVQKNPQAQAIRTKSKALLFVQMRKDSADSRPALVDQVLLFKKPGDNPTPVMPVANGEMNNDTWIEWAHGIWLGIHETDTLQYSKARDGDDEKHICPLQLGTIERCVKLYSNPGELVLSPFMGIGSEGYVSLKFGRRFVGCELKESYFRVAVSNLEAAVSQNKLPDLFLWAEQQEDNVEVS
jgi:DNA modification methylase